MNPNNANPIIVHLASPCAAACVAPGTFMTVNVAIDGAPGMFVPVNVPIAPCAPQGMGTLFGYPIVETELPAIGPIELAPVRFVL